MSWLKSLMIPFALFMWIGTVFMFVNYNKELNQALQERELEVICNYAADAAVAELVENSHDLNMDYDTVGYVDVDPEIALDTFVTIFLKAYNMSASEENIAEVRTKCIPVFCVAAYDGYYLATNQAAHTDIYAFSGSDAITETSNDLVFAPKMPYIYENNSKIYALNLGMEYCYLLNVSNVSDTSSSLTLTSKVTNPLSEDDTLATINAEVSDAIMDAVYEEMGGNVLGSILIPSTLGDVYSTMPIENVTVFAYVANIPSNWGGDLVDTFGIGGSQITSVRYVGAYTEGGQKYYQYLDKLIENGVAVDNVIENYYETPEEAAQNGYYFDFRYY